MEPPTDSQDQPVRPVSGWYPDPEESHRLRYWDGENWTSHVRDVELPPDAHDSVPANPPATGWTVETQENQPGPTESAGDWGTPQVDYGTYAAPESPLTGSGMRPISHMFTDAGRTIRRAWWPLTAISLLLGLFSGSLLLLSGALLIDPNALAEAIRLSFEVAATPDSVTNTELERAFAAVPRTQSVVTWVLVIGAGIAIATLISAWQVCAINRTAMQAASGHRASIGDGFRAGIRGGVRLWGYGWLIALVAAVPISLVVLVVAAAASVSAWLAAGLGLIAALVLAVAFAAFFIRILPLSAQAIVERGALRWSWRSTRGKFWAILGRWFLWSAATYLIIQVILSIATLPATAVGSSVSDPADVQTLGTVLLITLVTSVPLSLVLNSVAVIGVVPIWRDLTENNEFRSILDGRPVTPGEIQMVGSAAGDDEPLA